MLGAKSFFPCLLLAIFLFTSACSSQTNNPQSNLKDGEYSGYSRLVDVKVTIKNDKITGIEIVEHRGGGAKYENMILPLIDQIIKSQSLEVDAISGATTSSNYLKNAIKEALGKAAVRPAQK